MRNIWFDKVAPVLRLTGIGEGHLIRGCRETDCEPWRSQCLDYTVKKKLYVPEGEIWMTCVSRPRHPGDIAMEQEDAVEPGTPPWILHAFYRRYSS